MPVIDVAVSELTHTGATHSSTCGEETTCDNVNKGQTLMLLSLENDLVPPTLQQQHHLKEDRPITFSLVLKTKHNLRNN